MLPAGPPLPTLVEGLLGDPELELLFTELAAHGRILEVLTRVGPRDHASPDRLTLGEAKRLLLSGAVRAVQVRYHFDDAEWSDTLIRLPTGTRVVRCKAGIEGPENRTSG
jgi:hypothetical protein